MTRNSLPNYLKWIIGALCVLLLGTAVMMTGTAAYAHSTSIRTDEQHILRIPDNHIAVDTVLPGEQPLPTVFPSKLVLIDAGHGGIDGGTSHGDVLEKHINLAIAQKLYLHLKARGIPVILNRTGDYALSDDNRWSATRSRHRKDLAQRRQLSEEIPVSMFVSLHVNWAKNNAARGPVVLHQNEGRSRMLARIIQDSLNPMFGTRFEPEFGKTYYLLRRVQQPAVIVEAGFISNARDRALLTHPRTQSQIAARISDAIVHYQALF
ncbi:N-acetylmuramoyl-L-alanine amidase family protein [Paenibacillus sp. OSY-SE]|uniref:N-acetylmuramoyl-L-alanine amidase family protein n=1 Tax=Paenibacillus sp. OSY-SE TaxID=1196323 RepID=UPI00036893B0|nr:N-acetylmuramoyl-L-alanine amidase [Paenibacillus sp. OSY-SE]